MFVVRKIVFLFLLISSDFSHAQNVFPSYSDSAKWNVLECFWANCSTQTYQYEYDTLFCGNSYSKLTFPINETGYFRSDNLKTYFRKSTNCSDKEYLMYDYSMNTGDTVFVGYDLFWNNGKDTAEFVLGTIDTVNYFGVNRKRFKMFYDPLNIGGPFFSTMNWIEGIGSDGHPFYPYNCLWDGCEMSFTLLCYDSSGTQLYMDTNFNDCDVTIVGINEKVSEDEINVFPNPFQNQINFEFGNIQIFSVELYSNIGKLIAANKNCYKSNIITNVNENLSPGIYFLKISTVSSIVIKKLIKN